jgi:hypothetical protein
MSAGVLVAAREMVGSIGHDRGRDKAGQHGTSFRAAWWAKGRGVRTILRHIQRIVYGEIEERLEQDHDEEQSDNQEQGKSED